MEPLGIGVLLYAPPAYTASSRYHPIQDQSLGDVLTLRLQEFRLQQLGIGKQYMGVSEN